MVYYKTTSKRLAFHIWDYFLNMSQEETNFSGLKLANEHTKKMTNHVSDKNSAYGDHNEIDFFYTQKMVKKQE